MKEKAKRILLVSCSFIIFNGCNLTQSASVNKEISAVQTNGNKFINTNLSANETNAVQNDHSEEGNEIKECSPQKIYQGETLTISFRKPHGQNFAIFNEKTRDFYFLTENDRYYFPYVRYDEFKEYLSLELEVSKVRNNSEKLDGEGYYIPKPFFTKTGWYRAIVGHQALDVDFEDMPISGMCRFYYVNKKRPQGK